MTEPRLLSECCSYRPETVRMWSAYVFSLEADGTLTLLPADNHAAAYPLAFNKETGEIVTGKLNFFNRILFDEIRHVQNPATADILWKPYQPMHSGCIVINLLDQCYGHALLKMFNLAEIYRKYGEHYDLCVITNPSLSVFIPDEKFAVIEIKKSYPELLQLWNLESILSTLSKQYSDIEIAVLNTYYLHFSNKELISFFKLEKFAELTAGRNRVTFVCRADPYRKWGGKLQKRNIVRYLKFISEFFTNDIEYTLIGDRDHVKYPKWINDRRCTVYNADTESEYAGILGSSVITAGVHGSHLIMASLLSSMLVHLVPPWKMHNTGEDTVNTLESSYIQQHTDLNLHPGMAGFWAFSRKAARTTLYRFAAMAEKQYKVMVFETPAGGQVLSQDAFISREFPAFRYQLFRDFRISHEKRHLRLMKLMRMLGLT